jgi:hypothetical protein
MEQKHHCYELADNRKRRAPRRTLLSKDEG